MIRVAAIVSVLVLAGCGPDRSAPAGNTSDPVEVCTESAQVCRYDGAKLGVCTRTETGDGLFCASQH